MSSAPTTDSVLRVTGLASVGFGVTALLAPRTLAGLYGMPADTGEFTYLSRGWGSRTAAYGALALAASSDEERERMLLSSVALNGLDTLSALTTRRLPARTRVMAGLTSAGFAAAAVYALTADA